MVIRFARVTIRLRRNTREQKNKKKRGDKKKKGEKVYTKTENTKGYHAKYKK